MGLHGERLKLSFCTYLFGSNGFAGWVAGFFAVGELGGGVGVGIYNSWIALFKAARVWFVNSGVCDFSRSVCPAVLT